MPTACLRDAVHDDNAQGPCSAGQCNSPQYIEQDKPTSPADVAGDNAGFVALQKLSGVFDAEQAKQALEALNGTIKEES